MDHSELITEAGSGELASSVGCNEEKELNPEISEAPDKDNLADDSVKTEQKDDKPQTRSKKKKMPRELREFLIRITATAIVIWLALTFLIGVTICHSNTCYPMVKDGDLCITWLPGTPSQGELIVYKHNGETCFGRIVAVPGDRVELIGGVIWVNGYIAQSNPYADASHGAVEAAFPMTVPEDSVFVLNDNLSEVNDSRLFGTIPLSDCRGSVIFLMRRRGF